MNAVLFLILITIFGWCIEIDLPLKKEHEKYFDTEVVRTNVPLAEELFGVTCYDQFYEARGDSIITRVLFQGFELFYDKERRKPPFRRIVTYSHVSGRTYITVYHQYHVSQYEAAYYIANNHVYNLFKVRDLLDNEEYLINGKTPGKFISKMFRWLPQEPMSDSDESGSPRASSRSRSRAQQPHVKRKVIENDIDVIFERRLVGKFGIYSVRKREKAKRSRKKRQLRFYRHRSKSDTDSD